MQRKKSWLVSVPLASLALIAAACGSSAKTSSSIQHLGTSSQHNVAVPSNKGSSTTSTTTSATGSATSTSGASATSASQGGASSSSPSAAAENALRAGFGVYFNYLDSSPTNVQNEVQMNIPLSQVFPNMGNYFSGSYLNNLETFLVRAKEAGVESVQGSLGALSSVPSASGFSVTGCLTISNYAATGPLPPGVPMDGTYLDTWSMALQNGAWEAVSAVHNSSSC